MFKALLTLFLFALVISVAFNDMVGTALAICGLVVCFAGGLLMKEQ